MATADDLKKQQELNKALEEENAILRKRNKLQSEGYDASSSLVESLKEVLGIRTRQSTFEQDILKTNKDINRSILNQKSGLQDLNTTKNQIRKNNDLIAKASVLQLGLERSLTASANKTVESYVHKVEVQQRMQAAIDEQNTRLQNGEKIDEQALETRKRLLANLDQRAEKEFATLSSLGQQLAISKLNTREMQKQTEERKKDKETLLKLQASMGIAGALVKTLGSIPGLGDASAKAFEDVERKLKADAEATGKVASRWKTFGMIASETSKHLGQALTDPAVILTSIFATYLKINKASVDVLHLTGQNAVAAASWGANYATAVDYLETVGELTRETGKNAQNIFSSKVLGQAAALKTTMGLTAEEAGGLATISQTTGRNVNDVVKSVVATTSAFNGANRSAVSQGQILRDVATTSDSIKLSLGNNPEAIAKAASAARKLGLELKDVDQIASSLLEFESSIESELEAELLVGKDLNLEKARELALNNNLEGVAKELFKNSADIAEFGKMNRIQQEAYAKALGMSRDQLAKMAYQKALDAGMTEDQAAAAANVNAEDMKRIAMQENFAQALEKIAGAVAPILDIIGDILSMPLVPYILMGAFALSKLGGSISGVGQAFGGMYKSGKAAVTGIAGFFKKGGITSAIDQFKGAFGVGAGTMVQAKSGKFYGKDSPQGKMITNLSSKTGDVATEAKNKVAGKEGGTGFKDSMKNLADGLKEMGAAKVIQGIGNLALAGPALILALPSIPFLLFMGKVSLTSLYKNFSALGKGLKTMEGTLAGSGALLAFAAAGLLAVASIPFLVTIALIGTAAGVGLKGLAAGLKALGKGAGEIIIGIGLLALFNIALIPLGYALGLAAPAIEAFGKAIKSAFEGIGSIITAVADAFVTIIEAISMDNIGPMFLLGAALFGIAGGLLAIGAAGVFAIPGIIGLTALAAIAPPLTALAEALGMGGEEKSVGESKEKAEEGTLKGVEDKLAQLIIVIQQGGEVRLDGKKIGTTMSRTMPLTATKNS